MFVSVIIPTWNEENHIKRLLSEIREQSFGDLEVIVADANSQDKTVEIAESMGATVVRGGKVGYGRNRGAAAAKGDLFVFLDADAILPSKDFFTDIIHEMQYRRLDLAGTAVVPDSKRMSDRFLHWIYNRYIFLMGTFLPHAAGTCIIVKRFVHEAIEGFDESITLAEDHDYVRRGAHIGQFGIIKSHAVITDVRRLDKEGRFALALKYIVAEFYILIFGPIRGNAIKHEFGHTEDENK